MNLNVWLPEKGDRKVKEEGGEGEKEKTNSNGSSVGVL